MVLPKLTANISSQLHKFKISYSTSHFPPNLKHLFSKPPTTTASVAANEVDDPLQNANPIKSKKARTISELINTNPWTARLETRLSALTLTPLSQTTFFQTLRRIKAPTKALRFFNWAQDSGFTHHQQSYFMMLEILGRARHLNPARNFLFSIPNSSSSAVPLTDRFFNSLIRSYGDAGLFQESMKLFEVMKSMGVSPSAVTFNSLFLILLKRGRVGMVFELYDEMLKTYGVKPDSYTFNVLIRGFCKNSMVDEAFRMFREMDKFDCEPDLITYNTIVDGLCRAGKVNIARNVVSGMQNKCENLRPNVVTYTTLIRGYCGKQEIEEALDVFREMVGEGIKPNHITVNTIIKGLCEAQKLDMAKEILGECQVGEARFVPDTCTFNTILSAHCNQENLDEALKVFEKMKELKVKQDSATYSTIIRALCHKGSFEKAEELLDEIYEKEILLRGGECTPLTASYNPVFKYLCANGRTKKAERVFRQLMKRGKPDPLAFETLIFGHCKEGTVEDGYKLVILMLRRDFVPNIKIYESLIEGLLSKGEANLALDTLGRMLRSSHLPRTSTFHHILMELIGKGSASESAKLMMLMLDNEIRPNVNLSTDAVRVLFKSGMKDIALHLVKSLYEKGYIVNMGGLISFLCQDKKLLEASELLAFSLKNEQNIDRDVSVAVLTGLCVDRKLSEAFNLYYELLEKGTQLPLSCLEELRNAFEAQGKLKEAEFVAKRMLNS
ncbi:Tetratricopeptide repeat superfamily protein [Perilla frutescens var. hirtella]|nr:Tetratricopeptide repeat superfamily protein [Perilla frutescens var. frutescens]KAH6792755.1 Tetratricopeptide repeat superfamily protein [Perilla frutescens var. hirtella]